MTHISKGGVNSAPIGLRPPAPPARPLTVSMAQLGLEQLEHTIRALYAERNELRARVDAAEHEASWRRCAMEQATECAGCGKHKHTPARMDSEFGGYVCAGCMEERIHELRAQLAPPMPSSNVPENYISAFDYQR